MKFLSVSVKERTMPGAAALSCPFHRYGPFLYVGVVMARIVFARGWQQRLDREISKFMKDLADDVLQDMRQHCPVDTGELLADLDSEVVNKNARIGARSVPHAIYAEEGVGPHTIRPNSKQALHWQGARHPVNEVHHPGYHGHHFMKKALYKERGK